MMCAVSQFVGVFAVLSAICLVLNHRRAPPAWRHSMIVVALACSGLLTPAHWIDMTEATWFDQIVCARKQHDMEAWH